ncbi:hypothetical protein DPM33_29960 [Mesorhizobium hawassense]|uniref:Uncharacterized protein n=1 Tax=Mesorhizobium hawassense TaxID=1209954 RepID=A0A330HFS5_9HYPH|nr:hypothetical protein DPM33_29960 [Mesorhizobium hawassense]
MSPRSAQRFWDDDMHQSKDLKRGALSALASRPQISASEKTNSCRFRGLQLRAGTSRQPLSTVAA